MSLIDRLVKLGVWFYHFPLTDFPFPLVSFVLSFPGSGFYTFGFLENGFFFLLRFLG